jgi:hypothetical protein
MARRRVSPDGNTEIIRDASSHASESNSDRGWSRAPVDSTSIHTKLVEYADALQSMADSDHNKNRARERIYEGHELLNNRAAIVSLEAAGVGIAKLNASKSIIDTFVSRLSKDRPMPNFNVDDGDWQLKRKAKKYRQFIVGQMLETEFDDLSRDALLDGAVLGNGYTRIDSDDDVFAERVPVNEILYDKRECRYGKPKQAVRVYRIAKDMLAELYPAFKNEIYRAEPSKRRKDDDFDMLSNLEDYCDVYEGWDLPATKDSDDGRHGLAIDTATLVFEQWHEPRFPWAHLRLFKPRTGLMGYGFIDQLASLQHRVNCIVRDLQLNIAATGRGHFLVNENNDIPTELLTGWQPFKLKYKGGQPPTYVAPTPFNPAQLQALEFFIGKMYDLSGVSQANATSKSSLGAGASGIALDTQYDIDSDRFRMPQANYARYRLDDRAPRVHQGRAQRGLVLPADRGRQLPPRHARGQTRGCRAAREGRRHRAVARADPLRGARPHPGQRHPARRVQERDAQDGRAMRSRLADADPRAYERPHPRAQAHGGVLQPRAGREGPARSAGPLLPVRGFRERAHQVEEHGPDARRQRDAGRADGARDGAGRATTTRRGSRHARRGGTAASNDRRGTARRPTTHVRRY